jgi:hypothetical protein
MGFKRSWVRIPPARIRESFVLLSGNNWQNSKFIKDLRGGSLQKTSPPKALEALGGLAHNVRYRTISTPYRFEKSECLPRSASGEIGSRYRAESPNRFPSFQKTSSKGTGRAHTDYQSELTTRITWQPASGKALFRSGPPFGFRHFNIGARILARNPALETCVK